MTDEPVSELLYRGGDLPGPPTKPMVIKRYGPGDEVVRPEIGYAAQSIYSEYLSLFIALFREAHSEGAAGIMLEDVLPTRAVVAVWDGARYFCIGCGDWGGNLTFISNRDFMEAAQALVNAYELDDVDYLEELGSRKDFADHMRKNATVGPAAVALRCGLYL